jgi:hypothetical protein
VVTVRFTYSRAPGLGVTAEGVTAEVSLAAPGRQGRGKVLAPPGTAFDGCRITSWRVAAVEARA